MKNKKIRRYIAMFMILNLIFEISSPTLAFALTNGSMQPEYQSFEPAGSSEMVDLFTGDFKYNIPLMDVDGYPLNLSYRAGAGMETEASWVGLGWSLNPGVLNRSVNGLPDDFNGDQVQTITRIKPSITASSGWHMSYWWGKGWSVGSYVSGGKSNNTSTSTSHLLTYNNYKGFGYEDTRDSHFSNVDIASIVDLMSASSEGTVISSQDGGSFSEGYSKGAGYSLNMLSGLFTEGTNYNTRTGAESKTTSNLLGNSPELHINRGAGYVGSIPMNAVSYTPKMPFSMTGGGSSFSRKSGYWGSASLGIIFVGGSVTGGFLTGTKSQFNSIGITNPKADYKSYGFLYSQNADESSLLDFNRFRDGAMMEEATNASYASRTYDLFSACAQGMACNFRPFRSDIGTVRDPSTLLTASGQYDGLEKAKGQFFHRLEEHSSMATIGKSGEWNNSMKNTLKHNNYTNVAVPVTNTLTFKNETEEKFTELAYFKELGELTERDEDYEATISGIQCVSPVLKKFGSVYNVHSPISGKGRKKRDKRSRYIETLTADQAGKWGFEPVLNFYDANSFSIDAATKAMTTSSVSGYTNVDRAAKTSTAASLSGYSLDHHISEISMTNTNGDRYIYGIPAYNLMKKTVIFNASARVEDHYVTYGIKGYNFSSGATYTNAPLNASEVHQFVQYDTAAVNYNYRGKDNLCRIETTPAHASSFLLSNILSPDYVDVTGNGPSYDDLGYYTKFNYSKEKDYRWRTPYCLDPALTGTATIGSISTSSMQAAMNKGIICDDQDDKAFYQYGIRENYYLHSIETKNFVAVFKTSKRKDGLGVLNEEGKAGTSEELLKLDAVELYSKNEIIAKGGISNAIPLKTAHFVYSYSLCPGTYNTVSSGNPARGKLTLEKVYFTFGNSQRAALSPYEFHYADNDHSALNGDENNFAYDPQSMDRWGTYKPNSGTATGGTVMALNNVEFPYAEQKKELADKYAAAWNLTEIKTPSGSTIKITYEADDYGYVQNAPATQMMKIYNYVPAPLNLSADITATYSSTPVNLLNNPNFIIVDLSSYSEGIPASLSLPDAENYFQKEIMNQGPLYVTSFLKMAGPECGPGISKNYFDFVSTYANPKYPYLTGGGLIDASIPGNTYTTTNISGTGTVSCYRFAYFYVNEVQDHKSNSFNAVSIAGWDYLRNNVPGLAYPGSEPSNIGDPSYTPQQQRAAADAGLGIAEVDMENGLAGNPNKRFHDMGFCSTMYPEKSFLRVASAHKRKLGGGHRVKRITMEDNWEDMTNPINVSSYAENNTAYVQEFTYTTKEQKSINQWDTISSGVASYEPITGQNENSCRQYNTTLSGDVYKKFAPNDHFTVEDPLGEALYPAPVVGYSKVTVRTLSDPSVSDVSGNGKTEFEFYTAKDFPVYDFTSKLSPEISAHIPAEASLKVFINKLDHPYYNAFRILNHAQGNILRFNDMHGKTRSISVFGEKDLETPVSKIEYSYKKENDKLVSSALTIDHKNVISEKVIARDIDITADTRENVSNSIIIGNSVLFELSLKAAVTLTVPWVEAGASPSRDASHFKGEQAFGYVGATITKVVQEYGILEKIIYTYKGIVTTTENLLWDANTGNVLLTKVTNNFDQPVYKFSYPAYWAYPEMGPEFNRDNMRLSCPPSGDPNAIFNHSSGELDLSSVSDPLILALGDEVAVWDVDHNVKIGSRFWLVKKPGDTEYLLVDQNGVTLTSSTYTVLNSANTHEIQVVNPINNNKLNSCMGQVVSLNDPQNSSAIDYTVTGQKIIDAYSQEFCAPAGAYFNKSVSTQTAITLGYGSYSVANNPMIAGLYGDFKPSAYYKYQVNRSYGTQPNIKNDGFYSGFVPFWLPDTKWRINSPQINSNGLSCSEDPLGEDYLDYSHDNWRLLNKNLNYSPYGQLLQSKDAIGIVSSQRFGFNHTLPVLQASNAGAAEVGFDSFEDYAQTYPFLAPTNTVTHDYLGFYEQSSIVHPGTKPSFTTTTAHTGRYSLAFSSSQTVTLSHYVESDINYTERPRCIYDDGYYCYCLKHTGVFDCSRMELGKKPYIISMWIKGASSASDFSSLVNLQVKQTHTVSGTPTVTTVSCSLVKSAIINGWQKLDYELTIAGPVSGVASASGIEISISSGGSAFYLDDFRIQPFNSTMVCNVYDPYQLRLWAQLDDRNYATIFEYDNEGNLVRKKKETLSTIYTLQESRSGTPKR